MPEPVVPDSRAPGWREVAGIGALVVVVVLGAAVLTSILPAAAQNVVFHTPLAIAILAVGTVWVLWRLAHRPPTD